MTWPAPLPCGCPSAAATVTHPQRHDAYHRENGPATCLALCWCGSCPQYPEQKAAAERLRQQEYEARVRREGEKWAKQHGSAA